MRGFPLFHADDEHIHHRLEDLGFSKRRVVLGVYGICVVLSLIALSIIWSQGRTIPIAIGAVFLLAIFALRYLQYVRSFANVGDQIERLFARRRTVRYALLQAQILELEVDRCERAHGVLADLQSIAAPRRFPRGRRLDRGGGDPDSRQVQRQQTVDPSRSAGHRHFRRVAAHRGLLPADLREGDCEMAAVLRDRAAFRRPPGGLEPFDSIYRRLSRPGSRKPGEISQLA